MKDIRGTKTCSSGLESKNRKRIETDTEVFTNAGKVVYLPRLFRKSIEVKDERVV